jgi:hypothetical protein
VGASSSTTFENKNKKQDINLVKPKQKIKAK